MKFYNQAQIVSKMTIDCQTLQHCVHTTEGNVYNVDGFKGINKGDFLNFSDKGIIHTVPASFLMGIHPMEQ